MSPIPEKIEVLLHTLPAMAEFEHQGRRYRTITPINHFTVNRARKNYPRYVLDLQTFKDKRLTYYTTVAIECVNLSGIIEISE